MSSDSKAYIGGDPLPRPDTSDRGERGTPIKPKATPHKAQPKATHKATHKATQSQAPKRQSAPAPASQPKPKAPSYWAPDNYSTYGRPGTNDMGPSSRAKTINLGKLPATVGDLPSTGTSDFASRFPQSKPTTSSEAETTPNIPYIGGDPLPRAKSKHAYKVRWS